MRPEVYPFQPTVLKENGVYVLNLNDIPQIDGFTFTEHQLVVIPDGRVAANHMHPRIEAFVAISGQPELHWIDTAGEHQVTPMSDESGLLLVLVHSMLPHAVLNVAAEPAVLFELATESQHDVQAYTVIK